MVLLPEPLASLERFPLLFDQPSPLHSLPNLTAHVHQTTSCRAQLWAKREDCSSGLGLGGNKIRKLEYIMPDALARGCDTLVTTGGVQSNMMRQTAAVAHRLGLQAVLVPQVPHSGSVVHSEASFYASGNVQVNKILGAEYDTTAETTLDDAVARIRADGSGRRPFAIAAGGSAHARGGLGFARWAFEVAEQELVRGVFFDVVVVPVASGGTLGGMIAGFKLADRLQRESLGGSSGGSGRRERKIIGIDTYDKPEGVLEAAILEVARRTAVLIGLEEEDAVVAGDIVLDTRFNAGTHTSWDEQAAEGVRLLGRKEGIVSDPIYSGRTIGAVLKMAEIGDLEGKENVLFVHTGGQAALGAFPDMS